MVIFLYLRLRQKHLKKEHRHKQKALHVEGLPVIADHLEMISFCSWVSSSVIKRISYIPE